MKFPFFLLSALVLNCGFCQYATEFTVAKDGSGDFTSIQEAIHSCKAFPDKPVTIRIKKGVYLEKVEVFAWNTHLTLIGEDRDSTVISWDDHFDRIGLGRNSTFHTFTLKIEANDVILENLTIRNTAGPVGQAIALHVDADRVVLKNCSVLGNQDTLYSAGEGNRNYFESCTIAGTTDFIFGSATCYFQNCELVSKSNSFITAASTPELEKYGFVFNECKLTAAEEVTDVYLGRPWRSYAKTIFIDCHMGSHINKTGWKEWNNDPAVSGTYYGEYKTKGPGASPKTRASWSHELGNEEVKNYEKETVLRDWSPDTLLK